MCLHLLLFLLCCDVVFWDVAIVMSFWWNIVHHANSSCEKVQLQSHCIYSEISFISFMSPRIKHVFSHRLTGAFLDVPTHPSPDYSKQFHAWFHTVKNTHASVVVVFFFSTNIIFRKKHLYVLSTAKHSCHSWQPAWRQVIANFRYKVHGWRASARGCVRGEREDDGRGPAHRFET